MNKNQQVRLLAIGVSDYRRTEFTSLPSASNDSRELYGTFAKVLGSVLDSAHSVHAVNITADLFLSLLTYVLEQEMQDDALLVLYFSGHATIEQQVLTLHFVDSRDNRWGVVTTQEIDEILRRFNRPETVLILDCCYSGLAGSLAKSSNPFFPAKTTIISSSRPYEVSSYDSDHSIFTKALVNSLHFLDQSGERISVTKLHEQIEHLLQGKAEQNPAVFVREGRADVVLKSPDAGTKEEKKRFHIAFVQALLISNPSDRETLWYSLNEYPEHVILEVIHRSIDVELHEPLWLIRRAMGSTLSSVTRLLTQKKHLYLKLMGSTQWMDVCVGAIGARFDVTDDATCEALQDVSTSSMPMDAKWLAFLYLADRFHIGLLDRMDFLATDLTESKWGVCEIWERCIKPSDEGVSRKVMATERLLEMCKTDDITESLLTHVFLLDECIFDLLPPQYKSRVRKDVTSDDILVKYVRSKQRGLLTITGASKWLYSKLYGVWRGQVQDSLTPILQDLPAQRAKSFLYKSHMLPSVSSRMAIYQSMQFLPRLSFAYVDELKWGFQDTHPWVRRTAMEWLLYCSYFNDNSSNDISLLVNSIGRSDCDIYPGILDLIHVVTRVANYWGVSNDSINQYLDPVTSTLAPSDLLAIERSMKNELLPFKFREQ